LPQAQPSAQSEFFDRILGRSTKRELEIAIKEIDERRRLEPITANESAKLP